jgi:hypothetical protein
VVGYYTVCNVGNDRAFYWSEATGLVTLQFPFPTFNSRAYDINNEGMITGVYGVAGSGLGNQAFIVRPDGTGFISLGFCPVETTAKGLRSMTQARWPVMPIPWRVPPWRSSGRTVL